VCAVVRHLPREQHPTPLLFLATIELDEMHPGEDIVSSERGAAAQQFNDRKAEIDDVLGSLGFLNDFI
jgi:hypothetical protein